MAAKTRRNGVITDFLETLCKTVKLLFLKKITGDSTKCTIPLN